MLIASASQSAASVLPVGGVGMILTGGAAASWDDLSVTTSCSAYVWGAQFALLTVASAEVNVSFRRFAQVWRPGRQRAEESHGRFVVLPGGIHACWIVDARLQHCRCAHFISPPHLAIKTFVYLAGVWTGSPFSCALVAPTFPAVNLTIPEGSVAGAVVGTLNASTAASLRVTYAIAGGNTGNAFALDACSGALTVATPSMLVYATNPVFTLLDNALTNNDNSAVTVGVVTVFLTKVAKPPVLVTTAVSILVNSTVGTAASPTIIAYDDSGAATNFAVSSSSGTTFSIQSTGNNSAVLVLATSGELVAGMELTR